ncbi:nucleotide exchange factor GrpE [Agrococcus sp. SGAir0287]|uniref:nucleotide exchange factor GrpE n=1 Tax=Agrococcus sp. SGAir0287 TaxID=2070347 RepID=UPI0010CD3E2D|nr:nucleotide exchange factor GrpE [Agrococcus sp. SGAir0287]QCR18259.1 nucleotide exchange factor GrpE [Agrococcus sp. SGAir0287]
MTDDTQDEGPVFRDKRRIDPETGEARQSPADAQAAAERAAAGEPQGASEQGASDAGAQAPASAPGPDDLSAEDRALLDGEAKRLAEEAASVEARIAAAEDEVRRLQAEYVNYRNRVERERAADKVSTTASVLSALLPALDDLDRAEQHGDLEGSPLAIVAQKLRGAIDGLGLEPVGAVGEPFDTAVHEAIAQLPNPEVTEMVVADVVQRGYRMGERLVRAAKVAVFVPASE